MRNVSLRNRVTGGRRTWLLLGPDGREVLSFSAFAYAIRNLAQNTINLYCRHIAEFIDYLIEVITQHGGSVTRLQLTEAIEAYGDYLQLGLHAENEITQIVAKQIPPGKNSANTANTKKAALRRFLQLSEDLRQEMTEMARLLGERPIPTDENPLLPKLGKRRALTSFEVQAMQANSMLAGVISGGPNQIDCVVLESLSAESFKIERAFPYDKVMDLIDAAPTYRDKSLYAMLAATGCRGHESLQTLMSDVDVLKGTVSLVDPKSRVGDLSYRSLSSLERSRLAWKGRATDDTLMIEPFRTAFFESLKAYYDNEQIAHGRHGFIFQYLRGPERGQPYYLSAASSRSQIFKLTCKRIGVILPDGVGIHSLRHMYGSYLLNYFPRPDGGFGLPPAEVQFHMGHAHLKDTVKYARKDKDLRLIEVAHAHQAIFSKNAPARLIDMKIAALNHEIEKLKKQKELGAP